MRLRAVVLSAFVLAVTSPVAAQSHFPSDDSIRGLVRSVIDIRGNVGVVVGLLDAAGNRRIVTVGNPVFDGHTLFEIGSITKVFTGILLAYAVEQNELRLDQPLDELMPDNVTVPSRDGRQITLLNLATHTSGLPRMPDNFEPADPANPYVDYTYAKMYEFLNGHTLRRDIGQIPLYSNIGAALLGHALERRAGMSYEELVTARILRPLGMNQTVITIPDSLRARFAAGHDPRGIEVHSWELTSFAGAGALRSNAHDLLTFLAANLAPPDTSVLSRALQRARSPHHVGHARGGLHWGINRTPFGSTYIAHGGGTAGFSTFAGFDPERRVGVVVLANMGGTVGAQRTGAHLLDPRIPLSLQTITRDFSNLPRILAALLVIGVFVAWRRTGAGKLKAALVALATAIGAVLWLGVTQALARYGLLSFNSTPPTMAVLIVVAFLLAFALGVSRVGKTLAAGLPLFVLVGVHAFRLPLELMMHRAYIGGLMPKHMSYSGLNFDIITGITAIIVALLVATRRAGTRTVRLWNLLASLLLLNIIVVSWLSAPTRFRVFFSGPSNTWIITTPPYVWLPTVMVAFAILGHIVLFRRLRLERAAQTNAV